MTPTFFPTAAAFRRWLHQHHKSERELWVGFYKRSTGKPSITWPEAVDQLLCFGWIDGVRKSLGEESYVIRVTPRKPGSIWSAVNVKRAEELVKLGLMHEAGSKAFAGRDANKTNRYSFERAQVKLDKALEKQFLASRKAWEFFQAQPPGYRKTILWWIMSGKQEATREKRLGVLIGNSEAGRRVDLMRPGKAMDKTNAEGTENSKRHTGTIFRV
jgi:uncharacterized protein YdeI (YjbR/CyaY-like superfamily)